MDTDYSEQSLYADQLLGTKSNATYIQFCMYYIRFCTEQFGPIKRQFAITGVHHNQVPLYIIK